MLQVSLLDEGWYQPTAVHYFGVISWPKTNSNSTQFIELYSGISEQI